MSVSLNQAIRNSRLQVIADNADLGESPARVQIYDGVRPAPGGAPTTLLAECFGQFPFFASPSNGQMSANPISDDNSADASGTPTWFRLVDGNGAWILDGDVGVELTLNVSQIVQGGIVSITSFVITEGNA